MLLRSSSAQRGGGATARADDIVFQFERQSSSFDATVDASAQQPLVTDSGESGTQTDTAVATATATTGKEGRSAEGSGNASLGTNPSGQDILAVTSLQEAAHTVDDPGAECAMSADVFPFVLGCVTSTVVSEEAAQNDTTKADVTITVNWLESGDGDSSDYIICVQVSGGDADGGPPIAEVFGNPCTGFLCVFDGVTTEQVDVDPDGDSVVVQATVNNVQLDDRFTIRSESCFFHTSDPGTSMGNSLLDIDAEIRLRPISNP